MMDFYSLILTFYKAFSQMTIMETNYIQAMDKNEIGRVFISFSEINFDIIIKEFILEYNLYWQKFQVL